MGAVGGRANGSATRAKSLSQPLLAARHIRAGRSLLLMIGLGLGYLRYFNAQDDSIISEAIAARSDAARAEQSVAASAFQSPDAGDRLLASTLMMNVKAPDLTR